MRHCIFCLILLAASAQNLTAEPAERGPIELGLGWTGTRIADIDFLQPRVAGPALHLRATVPLTSRFSVEALTTVDRAENPYERRVAGLYTLQVKQRIVCANGDQFCVFATYGGTGNYARVTSPRYAYSETDPPFFTTGGAGFESTLGPHLALRVDAQLITVLHLPLAARISAGVSVPLGRY